MKKLNKIIGLCREYLADTGRRPTLAGGDIDEQIRSCLLELVGLMKAVEDAPLPRTFREGK